MEMAGPGPPSLPGTSLLVLVLVLRFLLHARRVGRLHAGHQVGRHALVAEVLQVLHDVQGNGHVGEHHLAGGGPEQVSILLLLLLPSLLLGGHRVFAKLCEAPQEGPLLVHEVREVLAHLAHAPVVDEQREPRVWFGALDGRGVVLPETDKTERGIVLKRDFSSSPSH
jgi:hypothetical protein